MIGMAGTIWLAWVERVLEKVGMGEVEIMVMVEVVLVKVVREEMQAVDWTSEDGVGSMMIQVG